MKATVTINGKTLSNAQVMAMRVAVSRMRMELSMKVTLSDLDKAYRVRLKELEIMLVQNKSDNVCRNPDKS